MKRINKEELSLLADPTMQLDCINEMYSASLSKFSNIIYL